jgi:aspartyl-tRNA(Asn)/glutamyl-tRNA(Gln) amidotransferase subunit A
MLYREQTGRHDFEHAEVRMPDVPITITEAAEWLRAGRITSVALTETLLARSHAAQDTIAAFITITDEPALEAARQADADFAAGIDKGPLQGIPLAVKDIIATRDAPTTANSHNIDLAWGEGRDATVVKKLRAAGAVLTGKLGLHEYATGWPDPDTGFRIPKNPWDLKRTPGGSSSGTGAAVAGGLILGGLGTDTGGSVRGPASYCGISGMKQTFGRVSKEGCVPLGYSLDHIGPMAKTARDCAIMLQVLAGDDPADLTTVDVPVPDMAGLMDGSLAGVRIGVPRNFFFTLPSLDPAVKAAVETAIGVMADAGGTVVEVNLPHADVAWIAGRVTSSSEAYTYHLPDLRTQPEKYGKYARRSIMFGSLFTSSDYVQAQRFRSVFNAECAAVLGPQADVLIVPTMTDVAPLFEGYDVSASRVTAGFMPPWNLTGLPAISIPCGFSDGLPIGMQVVGKAFDEPTVFKVADAYQQLTDWHLRVPEIAKEATPV